MSESSIFSIIGLAVELSIVLVGYLGVRQLRLGRQEKRLVQFCTWLNELILNVDSANSPFTRPELLRFRHLIKVLLRDLKSLNPLKTDSFSESITLRKLFSSLEDLKGSELVKGLSKNYDVLSLEGNSLIDKLYNL